MFRLLLLVTLGLINTNAVVEEEGKFSTEDILNLARRYVDKNYAAYRNSNLSFRKLKNHLVKKTGMPYEDFHIETVLGGKLDDEVEDITLRCDGGQLDKTCIWEQPPPKTESVWSENLRDHKEGSPKRKIKRYGLYAFFVAVLCGLAYLIKLMGTSTKHPAPKRGLKKRK